MWTPKGIHFFGGWNKPAYWAASFWVFPGSPAHRAKDKSEKAKEDPEEDHRRLQGGAADVAVRRNGAAGAAGAVEEAPKSPESKKVKKQGPCAAESLDVPIKISPQADVLGGKEAPVTMESVESFSDSETSNERRRKRRENAGLKAATGFGLAPPPAAEAVMAGLAGPLAPLPSVVKGFWSFLGWFFPVKMT